ncbi:uncharacterized protein BDV17DRAFT_294903 [Aspergillus undulatus]|uniref:uncharacterized protein n=1 Tax=Aspergillus undulatus TaxID=1810928 RepID=UPI003CCCB966
MRFNSWTILASLALNVSASPTGPTVEIPKSTVTEMTWDVQAFPNGPTLTLTGTVEQVHAQLVGLNPNYDNEDFGTEFESADADPLNPVANTALSADANDRRREWHFCMPQGSMRNMAWVPRIKEGISYLRKVKGKPKLRAGACSRVSCSWESAIWWCNDNSEEKTLPSYNNIAQGATDILNKCADLEHPAKPFGGSLDHPDQWRVVVKKGDC